MEPIAELYERPGHHQQRQHRQQAPAGGQHRGGRQVKSIIPHRTAANLHHSICLLLKSSGLKLLDILQHFVAHEKDAYF